MTFTVLALVAGVTIGYLTGGRLRHVAGHPLRSWWLVVAGFVLQAAVTRADLGWLGTAGLLAGYGCLLAFAAVNRALVGMGVVALGLAANALVIGLNGGMPVRPAAVVAAHIAGRPRLAGIDYGRLHHRETAGDRFPWLDDLIPVPELHQVLSFGDLVLAVGVGDVVVHLLHRRRRRSPAAPGSGVPAGFDDQAVGQAFDVLAQVTPVAAQRHQVPELAVTGPPADRFG